MIVDLAHVPHLTQRRPDAPLDSLSESPLPDDVLQLQMPDTSTQGESTEDPVSSTQSPSHQTTVAATQSESTEDPVSTESPNHLPSDAPVPESVDEVPRLNVTTTTTTTESETDNNRDTTTDETTDSSKPKPSASHNLPKLVIPEPDDGGARKRRYEDADLQTDLHALTFWQLQLGQDRPYHPTHGRHPRTQVFETYKVWKL